MSFAAAIAALAVAAQPMFEAPSAPRSDDDVQLTGDQEDYDAEAQRLTLRGHAVLRRGALVLRADELSYDQAAGVADGHGQVMIVMGRFIAVADRVHVDVRNAEHFVATFDNPRGEVTSPSEFWNGFRRRGRERRFERFIGQQKQGISAEQLLGAKSPEELLRLGQTLLTMTGDRLERVGPDSYAIDHVAFTPCDCEGAREPNWYIQSPRAKVTLKDRALLSWPVIRVQDVPILPLPWLSLPMTDRQTGLLIPRPMTTKLNGFSIDQPIFITLGRSYDLTLTPGYYAGGNDASGFGIKGPRLESELNYAPSERTLGRLNADFIEDLKPPRDPVDQTAHESRTTALHRGPRGGIAWRQAQDLGGGWFDKVDLALFSDGYYWRDLMTDLLSSATQYQRSTATVYHRDADSYFGVDAAFRQDLRWGYSPWGDELSAQGQRGPNTMQRLPAAVYAIPDRPLWGPIVGGIKLEYARLAPLRGLSGDEGADGLYAPPTLGSALNSDTGQGDGRYQAGEREARDRLDIAPRLSAAIPVGDWLRLNPYLSYREDLYAGEVTGQVTHRGYLMGGATAETEVSRVFDLGQTKLRHAVAPSVELRFVPYVFGGGPHVAYDSVDGSLGNVPFFSVLQPVATDRSMAQAVAQVRQRLALKRGATVWELGQLDVGQGWDLLHGRLGDAFARASTRFGLFSHTATVRYDPLAQQVSQLSAELAVDDARGSAVYARFDRLLEGGSDRMRAGMDELFGDPFQCPVADLQDFGLPAAGSGCPNFAEMVTLGARYHWNMGLAARYEVIVQPTVKAPFGALPGGPPPTALSYVGTKAPQHALAISYGPACDCWRVEAHAVIQPLRSALNNQQISSASLIPDFGVSVTVSKLGTFGN